MDTLSLLWSELLDWGFAFWAACAVIGAVVGYAIGLLKRKSRQKARA